MLVFERFSWNIRTRAVKTLSCFVLALFVGYAYFHDSRYTAFQAGVTQTGKPQATTNTEQKHILLYNSWWGTKDWEVGLGNQPFHRMKCRQRNCVITNNKQHLNRSHAVIFHIHELERLPPPKMHGQKFVFFLLESPGWSKNLHYQSASWKTVFDWTMTYRPDSDVIFPYGHVWRRHRPAPKRDHESLAKAKKKPVAWFVSNCKTQSKREIYMRELMRHISVDVYGRCGNFTCRKDWQGEEVECLRMLNDTYLFYIAFENSFCDDYVTEKLFKALPLEIVPVVRGGVDYNELLPRKWVIDTRDFQQPYQLAVYLKSLASDLSEYAKYFLDREKYGTEASYGIHYSQAWCDLCEKLHDDDVRKSTPYDMSKWWSKRDCHEPSDLIW